MCNNSVFICTKYVVMCKESVGMCTKYVGNLSNLFYVEFFYLKNTYYICVEIYKMYIWKQI